MKTDQIDDAYNKLASYLSQLDIADDVINSILSNPETVRIDGLGLDSRDMLMIAFFIEEDFEVAVEIENLVKLSSVKDLRDFIFSCAKSK
jgi:acyl carrier protein